MTSPHPQGGRRVAKLGSRLGSTPQDTRPVLTDNQDMTCTRQQRGVAGAACNRPSVSATTGTRTEPANASPAEGHKGAFRRRPAQTGVSCGHGSRGLGANGAWRRALHKSSGGPGDCSNPYIGRSKSFGPTMAFLPLPRQGWLERERHRPQVNERKRYDVPRPISLGQMGSREGAR